MPADPAVAATLATRYRNAALGDIVVSRRGTALWFDFGGWDSEMATRNDVDTPLLVTVSPGVEGFGFKVQGTAGQPTLISRRRLTEEHQIEQVGAKLRAMMPWIAKNKLVDQSKN